MFTLLHLSDLHRSSADPISNAELVSGLIADAGRHGQETPPISQPDAIIVSGDTVQGMGLGATNYPDELQRQYEETLDLLIRLSDEFLDGDRSKLIFVPGNHDVDWNAAKASMIKVGIDREADDIPKLLAMPGSPYRWSWKSCELYKVADNMAYAKRLGSFRKLFRDFYDGVSLRYEVKDDRDWNLFELDDGQIIVCGFNSCNRNDCFNFAGDIPTEAIAESHIEMRSASMPLLKIAVWHHNTTGPPQSNDYMDSNRLPLMLDKGYRIGLHGHHHKSDVTAYNFYTSDMQSMALVSAGSLCAGPADLPTGFRRQYNVIEISDDYLSATVHVREMRSGGVFVPGHLIGSGNLSHMNIKWTGPTDGLVDNTNQPKISSIETMELIERLIKNRDWDDAISSLHKHLPELGRYGRRMMADALLGKEAWEDILEFFAKPEGILEITLLTRASIESRRWEPAETLLSDALTSQEYDHQSVRNLLGEIRAAKGVSHG